MSTPCVSGCQAGIMLYIHGYTSSDKYIYPARMPHGCLVPVLVTWGSIDDITVLIHGQLAVLQVAPLSDTGNTWLLLSRVRTS